MRSKILSLAIAALMPLIANTQTKTYTVRQGDTLSEIASQFGVRQSELVALNGLESQHSLRTGATLRIPARTPSAKALKNPASSPATTAKVGGYVVRNGDSDWSVARRNGMTVKRLKELNPAVAFTNLKIGTRLVLESKVAAAKVAAPAVAKSATPTVKPETVKKPAATTVAKAPTQPGEIPTRLYTIKKGDNDWTLARKIDTRVAVIQKLNPGVDTKKLRAGMQIRIPSVYGANPDGTLTGKLVAQNGKPVKKPTTMVASAPKSAGLKGRYAVVNVDSGIIRRGASTTSGKVALIDKGSRVVVLDRQGEWYKLRFPKGTVGWMRGDLLKPVSASVIAREEANRTVASKPATIRTTPTKAVGKPTIVAKNSSRPTTSRPTTSSSKRLTANRPGKPIVVASNSSYDGDSRLLGTAKDQLGVRYRWGGTSRGGFDCSGFVQYVYKKNGVSLPRTSREMAKSGTSVSRSNLKQGDLITFATRGGRGVSHVGMYVGEGKFIHASSGKGRVMISSLSDSYYSKRIVNMRRVASSKTTSAPAKKSAPKEITAPTVDQPNE